MVRKLLAEIFNVSTFPAAITGLFPFSIDSENKFHFKLLSFPTIALLVRQILTLLCVSFHYTLFSYYHVFFASSSKTEYFTKYAVVYLAFFIEMIPIGHFIRRRHSLHRFFNKFTETLSDVLEMDFQNTNSYGIIIKKSDKSVSDAFLQILKESKKLRNWIVMVFLILYAKAFISWAIIIFRAKLMQSESPISPKSLNAMYLLPVFTIVLYSTLFFRLFTRIWIISIIRILTVGLRSLKLQIEQAYRVGNPKTVESVLLKFRRFESVVEEFNDLFSLFISIGGILSIVLTLIMNLLEAGLYLKHVDFGNGISFIFAGSVSAAAVYGLCWSANELEMEGIKCTALFRDFSFSKRNESMEKLVTLHYLKALLQPLKISPGSYFILNLRTLTSIAGVITTYMIVLIQFHLAEPTT
ncbi:unnamed protein product [Orchesella dallaii]|uniref:Gustatory receptor n=1 Tax=Orchesella dallaii TaxID=48710 RepID=A0ABP1R654_9HEXA